MTGDQHPSVEDLFAAVVALAPEDRLAYLEFACKGNDLLLHEMRRLLANDSRAGNSFLTPPPPAVNLSDHLDLIALALPSGTSVAAYTVNSLIGEGGMGKVYLAEQANPRRNVALKVMHSGGWSEAAVKRFEVESHILAFLRHPNVAQIYEAGAQRLESGIILHYFALEYVPSAASIIEFSNENSLSIRKRLELFLQLSDAVQHGHQKGVIHRDLKPENILVDPEGRVKVIDFGISRVTDSDIARTTLRTEVGQLLGTLAYMSPEQCTGDPSQIDTTTDVYSLGVILFELLTGRLPYDVSKMTIHSAIRVICEQEPAKPSEFDRSLRGDLQTIILKSIEKDRIARYQTVADLASDIRRFLDGEFISARAPTKWTRAIRWAMKHPKISTTISCAIVGLLVLCSTLLAVNVVNGQPYRIELTRRGEEFDGPWGLAVKKGDQATIYSLSNRAMHTWKARDATGIRLAEMVDRPPEFGGGKVVVLGFAMSAESEYRGQLCVFDADGDYDQPIWHKTVDQEAIDRMPKNAWPRPSTALDRKFRSEKFQLEQAWMFDVFPEDESPGPEIVAYHLHAGGSQGVLRIYNLRGDVLFQAWHDGQITDTHWMKQEHLLICAAIKADEDEFVQRLGLIGVYPRVIFAIRPEIGDVSEKWIYPYTPSNRPRSIDVAWEGEWFKPEWYKLPCPIETADAGKSTFTFDEAGSVVLGTGVREQVELRIDFPKLSTSMGYPYGFSIILDKTGAAPGTTPTADDVSRQAWSKDKRLPNPDDFKLLDWTATEPPCGLSDDS